MSFSDYDLKDLGKIITGRTPSSAKVSQAFSNIKGTPFLTPRDMDGRRLIRDTERYLTSDGLQSVLSAAIPAHSISVSCIGSDMGKAVINDIESVTNQQINTIVPNEKIVNYLYLYYVLSSKQEYLKSIASGSATPILNKTAFGNIKIKLPSIGAQQKIAKILGDLDKKIEINNQINETLEAMAQAIYKSWFVDFDPVRAKAEAKAAGKDDAGILRAAMAVIASKSEQALAQMAQDFPDEYKKLEATAKAFPDAFVESELGLIPEGWEVSSLGNLCDQVQSGGTPKRTELKYWNGDINWLSSGEVHSLIITETKEKITASGLQNSSAKLWTKKTTIVAMYGATAGKVCFTSIDLTANQACCALVPKENFEYFLFMTTKNLMISLAGRASGSAQQNLNKSLGHVLNSF